MTNPIDAGLRALFAEAIQSDPSGIDQLPAAEDELIDLQREAIRVTVLCGSCQGKGCDLCQDGEVEFPGDGYDIVWGP